MKKVVINKIEYEVVRNEQDCLDTSVLAEKITEYFDPYDYIFGDYAYEKVRLKGFYESNKKNANKINDIKNRDDYITNYCSYGSKIFLLKKIR